ncbi:MAG: hypothetical protein D3910_20925 [Candidatus Electrothrix sp. ATG2]|nr:hypothetical protein [Candidatus Electrothrix sp. ATG2]
MKDIYFYAGNTPYINGVNKQFYGTFTCVGSPAAAVRSVASYKAEELSVEYEEILLTCFNKIGEVAE